ncbi:MAG: cytochrome c4 [Betaproteobacteria bacterium]
MSRLVRILLLLAAGANLSAQASPVSAADTIAERVKPCLACHAAEGRRSKDEYYPRLAGKPQGYLFNQMLNFRDGRRLNRAMSLLMQNLSDEYLQEIAGYFASLEPHYSAAKGQATEAPALIRIGDPARKIPACTACHGKELLGVAPSIPGLLGLPNDYVAAQMGAWRVDLRRATTPDCMGGIAKQLSDVEVNAVAQWLAVQPLLPGAHPAATLKEALPMKCGSVPTAVVTGSKP